jgi:hypothetical protein
MGVSASQSALEKRSGTYAPACSVLLGNLEGERHASGLHAISASSYEGPHIRLRYPVPDHVACIEVSTCAHGMTGCFIVQEFNRRTCNRI